MKLYGLIYYLGSARASRRITQRYGNAFERRFRARSRALVKEVIAATPDIGGTMFSFNYAFTPAYIAWYRAAKELGLDGEETQRLLWMLNEGIIRLAPRFLAKALVGRYLGGFRKRAPEHEARMRQGKLHPYDYLIRFRDVDPSTFEIDVTRCGMMTLAKDFDALGIFPAVCRVDYLLSSYLGAGFERTKTLGDGDDCCNCRYRLGGSCEWAPEKGFETRK